MNRPHCQAVTTCVAKTPGKHCVRCAAASPEVRARKSAGIMAAMDRDPAIRADRAARARAMSADPAVVAKRTEAQAWTKADDAWRAKFAARCAESKAERMQDPAFVERLRQAGRDRAAKGWGHLLDPEARERARKAIKAKHLDWCPEEHWSLNAALKAKGFRLAERKAIIGEEVERSSPAAQARRQIAQFDRDQRARREREKAQAY